MSLPNLLLALLPHIPPEALRENDPESNEIEEVLVDITKPGILTITETVKTAFKDLLAQRNVELRFTYGHWSGLAESIQEEGRYDLVLTSETIYAEESVDDLLAVLRASYRGEQAEGRGRVEVGLEESLDSMRLSPWKVRPLRDGSETVILIAAKVSARGNHARRCHCHGFGSICCQRDPSMVFRPPRLSEPSVPLRPDKSRAGWLWFKHLISYTSRTDNGHI